MLRPFHHHKGFTIKNGSFLEECAGHSGHLIPLFLAEAWESDDHEYWHSENSTTLLFDLCDILDKKDCSLEDIESLLDSFINNHKRVLPMWAEGVIKELGFKRANLEEYRNGLHVGDNADPIELHKEYCLKYPEVILLMDTNMFTASFNFYVRENNEDHKNEEVSC